MIRNHRGRSIGLWNSAATFSTPLGHMATAGASNSLERWFAGILAKRYMSPRRFRQRTEYGQGAQLSPSTTSSRMTT
jgi:hypothetical protein